MQQLTHNFVICSRIIFIVWCLFSISSSPGYAAKDKLSNLDEVNRANEAALIWKNQATKIFEEYDADKNAELSWSELSVLVRSIAFKSIDRDKNKIIRLTEFRRYFLHCKLNNQKWGCDNQATATKQEFEREIRNSYLKIDANENGIIDEKEYRSAIIRCRKSVSLWKCLQGTSNLKTSYAEEIFKINVAEAANRHNSKVLSVDVLHKVNEVWRLIIEHRVDSYWQRVCSHAVTKIVKELVSDAEKCKRFSGVKLGDFASFLQKESLHVGQGIRADVRQLLLEKQMQNAVAKKVSKQELRAFYWQEIFNSLDADRSKYLDVVEFKARYEHEGAEKDFRLIAGRKFLISQTEFLQISATHGRLRLARILREQFDDFASKGIQPASNGMYKKKNILTLLAKDEKKYIAEKAKAKNVESTGVGYLPGTGMVIVGERKYDQKSKSLYLDKNKTAIVGRLIKNYANSGPKAEGALFQISKEAGSDSLYSIDGALRLDFYFKDLMNLSNGLSFKPAIGFQMNRETGGDTASHKQQFFLNGDLFVSHPELIFWDASRFQFGPVIEKDRKANIERLSGMIEFDPALNFGFFRTGVKYPFDKSSNFRWLIRPNIAARLKEVIKEPVGSSTPDESYFRYGLYSEFSYFEWIEFTYKYHILHSLNNFSEDTSYQNATLKLFFDKLKRFSLTFDFQKGEKNSAASNDVEKYTAGIGVKF